MRGRTSTRGRYVSPVQVLDDAELLQPPDGLVKQRRVLAVLLQHHGVEVASQVLAGQVEGTVAAGLPRHLHQLLSADREGAWTLKQCGVSGGDASQEGQLVCG